MSDTIHIHIERECPVRVITVEPTGARGAAGTAATVTVGTTTTGAAGTNASVTNSGTTSAAVFNFTIPRGDTGATGASGGSSTAWRYRAKTNATSGYPTNGHLLWNNATQTSATEILVSHLDDEGSDIEFFLSFFLEGQKIFIQNRDDSSQNQVWEITGTPTVTNPNTSTAYYTFPVTLVSSAGAAFTNNHSILFGTITQATNSVTSATTSDGTASLNVASVQVYPSGSITLASTNSGGVVILSGQAATDARSIAFPNASGNLALVASTTGAIASADITDATSDGNANKGKVLKTDSQGSLTVTNSFGVNASFGSSLTVGDGDSINGRYDIFANTSHFQWYSDSALYGEREFVITTENLTSSGAWAYKYPAASGTFAVTASTTGVPDKLTDGTIAGTLTLNSTSYTYGTGAAASHRTALGLTTLATTPPAANVATFLETPTSANLAAAVTDKTGSGSLVFGTSPTLTTPTIAAINGGTAANDDITIQGTTNATRTTSYVNLQPNGGNVGIGTATPTTPLYIYTAGNNSVTIEAGIGDSQVAFRSGGSPRFLFGYEDADDGFRIYNYGTTSTALFVKSNTGNVGIGTTTPSAKAILDLTSTTKGFLPPRMTTTERNAITSVPAGLMIYNTSLNKLNVYNGTTWETVTSL
jgi:hypothetical protein